MYYCCGFFRNGLVLCHDTVEDYYADIATVFHWDPFCLDRFKLDELAMWRDKAADRNSPSRSNEADEEADED
ncbi:GpE family phage tail protein [Hydrogenovibrio marinus]|uniref:GpE family phage tail protein n=1 Tax=Hydrogenovibrio marinus TaxID=28885 RepID=UPI0012596E7F|nr:GpE family phage tail protein [Hydrogenovibrio marinus]BBN59324.1 hypothetical protein HVMH_0918 [Hydrogenovibrio marinus]